MAARKIYTGRLNDPRILWACHFKSLANVEHPGEKGRLSHDNQSIPSGDRYILIFASENPEIFANPTVAEYHESLNQDDLNYLKMRCEERYNIMTEEARGPGSEENH